MNHDIHLNHDEEYTMPCAEALLAGTLALMTGHVQASCAAQRDAIAPKVVSNLLCLSTHPLLSAPFKTMLGNLRGRWQEQIQAHQAVRVLASDHRLWHASPTLVQ